MDLNLKYPAHILVMGMWDSRSIDMQKWRAPAMIWVESSPNCPLPKKIEPEFLEDVISNVKADTSESVTLSTKCYCATKVPKIPRGNPEPEGGFTWGGRMVTRPNITIFHRFSQPTSRVGQPCAHSPCNGP